MRTPHGTKFMTWKNASLRG